MIDNLLIRLAESQESVLAKAITNEIGKGWSIESLSGRLRSKIQTGINEIISIDGIEILEFFPVQFEQVTEGHEIKTKAVRNYRFLIQVA